MIKLEQPHKPEVINGIIDQIKNDPKSYEQGHFGLISNLSECGTACCIAGWAVTNDLLSRDIDWSEDYLDIRNYFGGGTQTVVRAAERILGVSMDQADYLFSGAPDVDWPEPWNERWREGSTKKEEAETAIDLL